MKKLLSLLMRHKNLTLVLFLAVTLSFSLLLHHLQDEPTAQTVMLPLTSSTSTLSALESFRMSRDNAYERDVAALETLVSAEDTDRVTRQQAADTLEKLITQHQTQLALEGALLASDLQPCCAVVTEQSLTIVTQKQEITAEDTALVLTLSQLHAGFSAENVQIMTAQ